MKNARNRHRNSRHANRTPSVILLGPPRPPVTLPRSCDAATTADDKPALALGSEPEPLADPHAPPVARAAPAQPQRLTKRQARRAAAKASRRQHKAVMKGRPVPLPAPLLAEAAPVAPVPPLAPVAPVAVAEVAPEPEPTAELAEAARTPLPRARALAIHRPRGPLAVIAFWTRSAVRSLAARRAPEASAAEHLAALRGQVALLQQSIDRLEQRLPA